MLDTGAGAVMPMARAGEVCAATPGQLDDLASAISGTLRTVDRVVAELERAVRRSIDVLEKTKGAFKSKELGELRTALEGVLEKTSL